MLRVGPAWRLSRRTSPASGGAPCLGGCVTPTLSVHHPPFLRTSSWTRTPGAQLRKGLCAGPVGEDCGTCSPCPGPAVASSPPRRRRAEVPDERCRPASQKPDHLWMEHLHRVQSHRPAARPLLCKMSPESMKRVCVSYEAPRASASAAQGKTSPARGPRRAHTVFPWACPTLVR